jgi:competence protein ComEA
MMSRSLISFTVVASTAAVLASTPSAQSTAGQPPAGPGRDALFKICSDCHSAESALSQLKTHDEWVKTLDEMANNGAQGSDEEWTQIQAYLDKHYSFIFINKATAKELESTLDVAPAVAEAIVRRRTEKGNFTSIDDVKRVPGVDPAGIDARKDRFLFSISEGHDYAQNRRVGGSRGVSRRDADGRGRLGDAQR